VLCSVIEAFLLLISSQVCSYYTQHLHQQHPVLAKPQLHDRSHTSKAVAICLIFLEGHVSQSDGSFLWWLITCISGNGHPVLQAILSEVVCNGAWPQTHNVSFAMSMRCYRLQIHSSKVHELCLWHVMKLYICVKFNLKSTNSKGNRVEHGVVVGGQAHLHLLVMQSRGVSCICRRVGQGHSARPSSGAKKWVDCSPGEWLHLCHYTFLFCSLGLPDSRDSSVQY